MSSGRRDDATWQYSAVQEKHDHVHVCLPPPPNPQLVFGLGRRHPDNDRCLVDNAYKAGRFDFDLIRDPIILLSIRRSRACSRSTPPGSSELEITGVVTISRDGDVRERVGL